MKKGFEFFPKATPVSLDGNPKNAELLEGGLEGIRGRLILHVSN